jgi:predicted phage-related endonuclease
MVFGKSMEDSLAKMYEWRTGSRITETQICGEADDTPFPMRATLDAIDEAGNIVEFKAVSIGGARLWPEDGDAENLPPRVIYQVQHQMRVAERDRCIVFAGIPLETRLYEVRRNDEIISLLMDMEKDFWDAIQLKAYPLPIMDEDAETFMRAFGVREDRVGLSHEVQMMVDLYEETGETLRELEAQKKRLRERILAAMVGNRYGCLPDGRMIDCKLIEIKERTQVVKAHTQLRLMIKKGDSEHGDR